jgi:hypothetical protein
MTVGSTNKEIKDEYKEHYNNYLLLVCLGFIWIFAGIVGFIECHLGILFLFVGLAFFQTITNFIRKKMKLNIVNENNPSRILATCIFIGVPFGIILGFYPFTQNINMFFPVFGILFGLIFMMMAYVFKLKTYAILGLLLIGGGLFIANTLQNYFSPGGLFTGVVISLFGLMFRFIAVLQKRFHKNNKQANKEILQSKPAELNPLASFRLNKGMNKS